MAKKPRLLIDWYFNTIRVPDDDATYIVIYSTGRSPPKEFYQHLRRLAERELIEKIGTGSVICKGRKTAMVVKMLAEKYSFRTKIFKVVEAF